MYVAPRKMVQMNLLQSRKRDRDADNEHADTGGWGGMEIKRSLGVWSEQSGAILPELGVCEQSSH